MKQFLTELNSIPAPLWVRGLIAAIIIPLAFVIVVATMPIWGMFLVVKAFVA